MQNKKGFTLIELLIVLALISVLAGILIVVIKPQEIFRRARDTQRQSDLNNVSRAIDAYLADTSITPSWCNTSLVSFSIVTTSRPNDWPALPSGYSATGTTSTALDGTGWVRLPLASSALVNLSALPLDPLNGQVVGGNTYVYAFVCTNSLGQYELDAKLEANTQLMTNDGGNQTTLYEVGPNKSALY